MQGRDGLRIAVVLFNLGGPDKAEAIEPFLFNLFNDPAIIRLPGFLRWFLAKLISRRRAPIAATIYAHLGGGSPLLANSQAQAAALAEALADLGTVKIFLAMRYWHPMAPETIRQVAEFGPDRIVLLPLYPQFSSTTTGSSLKQWNRLAAKLGLKAPTRAVCCYPSEPGFVASMVDLVRGAYQAVSAEHPTRVLFSAHGLPERVIESGDPYQFQVERTAAAVVAKLGIDNLDWSICYQSRVGPLKWIGPSTDEEIQRAGVDGKAIVLSPIAFVSEHSETLVELDIEYRHLATESGVPRYERVPTVSIAPEFIDGLAQLVRRAAIGEGRLMCGEGSPICGLPLGLCPYRAGMDEMLATAGLGA
jgi:ferrochelatase